MSSLDGPKTVTFNAEPATEAQYRSARLGSKVIGYTLGLAAIGLAIVAMLWSLNFALALAVSWGEALKLGLVAIGSTLAFCGLPVGAAMLSRSYPDEARHAMLFWRFALMLITLGLAFFTFTLSPVVNKAPAPSGPSSSQIRRHLLEVERRVRDDVWYYSNGCHLPQDGFQRRHCQGVIAQRDALRNANKGPGTDWSPRAVLPISLASADGIGRHLLVLMFGLMAIVGAGMFGRWAVLSMAESYRLGLGEASPQMGPALPAIQDLSGSGALTPADVFSMWANGRLMSVSGSQVTGSDAYDDFVETCKLNGIEAMAPGKFGTMLTARAVASDGRIVKQKTGGVMVYRGWQLPQLLADASAAQLAG